MHGIRNELGEAGGQQHRCRHSRPAANLKFLDLFFFRSTLFDIPNSFCQQPACRDGPLKPPRGRCKHYCCRTATSTVYEVLLLLLSWWPASPCTSPCETLTPAVIFHVGWATFTCSTATGPTHSLPAPSKIHLISGHLDSRFRSLSPCAFIHFSPLRPSPESLQFCPHSGTASPVVRSSL